VGTFIPPHLTAATFAALSLTTFFGFDNPARIMGILFACMPLAWLGAKAEGMIREQERASYNKLLNWTRNPETGNMPAQLVLQSICRTFLVGFLLFYISILVLKFTLQLVLNANPGFLASVDISWAHLWVAATMGGLMALRLRRAYAVLGAGVILIALLRFSGCF